MENKIIQSKTDKETTPPASPTDKSTTPATPLSKRRSRRRLPAW